MRATVFRKCHASCTHRIAGLLMLSQYFFQVRLPPPVAEDFVHYASLAYRADFVGNGAGPANQPGFPATRGDINA